MDQNPFLKRSKKKDNKGYSGRQSEKKTSQRLSADLRVGSGAIETFKGDMTLGEFLIEAKSTKSKSFKLEKEWFFKINNEALREKKYPALSLTFTDFNGDPIKGGKWVCVQEHVFKELNDAYKND